VFKNKFPILNITLTIGMLFIFFLKTDKTTLNSGQGIDGMWYDKVIIKEDINQTITF